MDNFKIPDSSSIVSNRPKDKETEEGTTADESECVNVVEESTPSPGSGSGDAPIDLKKGDKVNPELKGRLEKKSTPEAIFAALTYEEPINRAAADIRYKLEVLKNGSITDIVNFKERSSYVIGRIPGCDIAAEHPTISRIHAILQFVGEQLKSSKDSTDDDSSDSENLEKGLYIYDLNSTHGTFLNKNRVYPNRFYRLHVGHVLKFGNSTRLYVVVGPSDDEEEESDKTVTELLQERVQKELQRKKMEVESTSASVTDTSVEESEGIDWGMGEDADEESDLRENPFAMDFDSSELNLDNPKKTLRGWFEKEGCDLVYDVREKANGQFLCTINLPIDGPNNRPVFAEVDVKGKKKEAVAQCALQACQILDKYGLLRQSHRENKSKRKVKNAEDEDFYSSDEDTFLDRTGSVEKKREKRMKLAGKIKEQTETYDSLISQNEQLQKQIDKLNNKIAIAEKKSEEEKNLDPLDAYMMDLKSGVSDIKKLKSQLKEFVTEQNRITKLIALVKPTALPAVLSMDVPERHISPVSHVMVDTHVEEMKSQITEVIETIEGKNFSDGKHEELADENINERSESKVKQAIDGAVEKVQSNLSIKKLYGPKPQLRPFSKQPAHLQPTTEAILPVTIPVNEEESEEENDDDEQEKRVRSIESLAEDAKPDSSSISKRKRNRKYKKEKTKDTYGTSDPDYSVWLPPEGQSGDGRTSLNEKLGY